MIKILTPIVYPNPAHDVLRIDSEEPVIEVVIYELSGRTVKKLFNQNTIDVSALEKGVYNLEIRTEETKVVKKIIVN